VRGKSENRRKKATVVFLERQLHKRARAWPHFLESLAHIQSLLPPSSTLLNMQLCFPLTPKGVSPPLKLSRQLDIPGACQPRRQQSADGLNVRGLPPTPSFLIPTAHREAARNPAQAAPRAHAPRRARTGRLHPAGEVQGGFCISTGCLPGQDGHGQGEQALDFGEWVGYYSEGSGHSWDLWEGMGVRGAAGTQGAGVNLGVAKTESGGFRFSFTLVASPESVGMLGKRADGVWCCGRQESGRGTHALSHGRWWHHIPPSRGAAGSPKLAAAVQRHGPVPHSEPSPRQPCCQPTSSRGAQASPGVGRGLSGACPSWITQLPSLPIDPAASHRAAK